MIPGIEKLGFKIDQERVRQLDRYMSLIQKWNERINLTASSDIALLHPMLLEGVWSSQFYPKDAGTHIDIGSGAGFPAIPIHLMAPKIQLDIVESRFKKVCFLENAVYELNMGNIKVFHERIDRFLDQNQNAWDCISWKGIRIKTTDLMKLKRHATKDAQFWIFHGKTLAVEDAGIVEKEFKLLRREKFPCKSDWNLSIYLPQ
jgi:16S rRNA (guanine(527)-N(7))-methyltransferase RsmG